MYFMHQMNDGKGNSKTKFISHIPIANHWKLLPIMTSCTIMCTFFYRNCLCNCLPYCACIFTFFQRMVHIHSFSVIFHHLSVHVNIRSAHCPCTYSLAVYIYNTWEDIIIYAFCLFVYIERIFLSKKSRQKRLPRINCTKLC